MASASPDLAQHFIPDLDNNSGSRPIDIPASTSYRLSAHWPEQAIDFNNPSPGFAYTPSYVGSFGSQQDSALHNWGERESTAVLQSHHPSTGDFFEDGKYEPEGYGSTDHVAVASGQASPFLMMENLQQQGVNMYGGNDMFAPRADVNYGTSGFDSAGTDPSSATAAARHFSPRSAEGIYSAGSPASSIGFADHQQQQQFGQSRSRASSVSSYHDASPYMQSTDYHSTVSEHFDRLNFDNTGGDVWNQQRSTTGGFNTAEMSSPPIQSPEFALNAPAALPDMSPQSQTTSPPTLLIPAISPPATSTETRAGPLSDPLGNVAINFVPATPISAGAVGNNPGGFQKILADLARGRHQPSAFDRGNISVAGALPSISSFRTALDGGDSATAAAAPRAQDNLSGWGSILSASGQSQGTATSSLPQQSRPYHHGYNLLMNSNFNGNDSASSTSQRQQQSNPAIASSSTPNNMSVDMQPNLPHHSQSDSVLVSSMGTGAGHLGLGAFGTASSDLSQHGAGPSSFTPNHSEPNLNLIGLDDMSSFLAAPIVSSRSRSKSDVTRPPVWSFTPPADPSSSTTTSTTSMDPFAFNSPQRPALMNIYPTAPAGSLDPSFGIDADLAGGSNLKRANSDGSRAHRRGIKSEDLNALRGSRLPVLGGFSDPADYVRSVTMADGSLAPVDPRVGVAGPTRRRGSGAGHERTSSLSSLRSTPYSMRASPHSSPGQSPHPSPSALPMPLHDNMSGGPHPQSQPAPGQQSPVKVERALVTTPATKTASANRRRAEANFVCPVPGCGSTFTRHFNLRGHMRSHNEERPFKCKWPGCEKGFARQHDCKRHEALHLNIRPYTCEGCQKTFARMDALNRHLRSEGGVECQKHHRSSEESSSNGDQQTDGADTKVEDPASMWNRPIVM